MEFKQKYKNFLEDCKYGEDWPAQNESQLAAIAIDSCSDLEDACDAYAALRAMCDELANNLREFESVKTSKPLAKYEAEFKTKESDDE